VRDVHERREDALLPELRRRPRVHRGRGDGVRQEAGPRKNLPVAAVREVEVPVDVGVQGERGGPGSGKAAAPEHRLGRHACEDVLDDLVWEILAARWRRRQPRLLAR
jgi:hypothetical protein